MTKGGNCGCSAKKYSGGKKYRIRTMKHSRSRKYRGGNDLMNQTNEQLGKWKDYLSNGFSNLYSKAKNTVNASVPSSTSYPTSSSNIGGRRKRTRRTRRK